MLVKYYLWYSIAMVFKRSKRSNRKAMKRGKPRRKGLPGNRTALVNRALHPLPQRYITKQKYSTVFPISSLVSMYQFNLNSVYDPDRTGVGHQPYGFDQLAALYNRYRVISCSYVINVSSGANVRFASIASNETPSVLSLSDLVERPKAQWKVQPAGANPQYLKGSCYIPSLVGRNKAEYMADDRYQSNITGSPAELALLSIMCRQLDDTAVDAFCSITLNYTVEYFDINQLGQS